MSDIASASREPRKLSQLAQKYELNAGQIALLRTADVRTEADFYSFLKASPDLGRNGLFDTPGLSAQLVLSASVTLMREGSEKAGDEAEFSFGAVPPEGAPFQIGEAVPPLTEEEFFRLSRFERPSQDFPSIVFKSKCGPWPPRNQGSRGTCVSFATIALYEHYLCLTQNTESDLSEQFLYWALKHHNLDPYPGRDGTWFQYILPVLARFGTCPESDWPYVPRKKTDVSHNPPPPAALAAAPQWIFPHTTSVQFSQTSGKAAIVRQRLETHGAVGVALPVFSHPSNRNDHNWNTSAARSFGEVQGPLPGWIADGGHAVCVVGFDADEEEPLGGHFVIRNSWGTAFGSMLPDSAYSGPEPGYGQISASHMDKYLWELCVFG